MRTLKGFRDFLPAEKKKRDFLLAKASAVAERFGFEPLETPTLEYASLLLGKYGTEADKLVYTFTDKGGREVALRYDQTVPTARILAQYGNELPRFFRRYQVQNVFRADKPQKGRYREFTQFDIDIFNSRSEIADAEILACTYAVFQEIGYPGVRLKVNDRNLLFASLEKYAAESAIVLSLIQTIDKLEKIGEQKVVAELVGKGLPEKKAGQALKEVKEAGMSPVLEKIVKYARGLGVPAEAMEFSPTLARGLDYYTGMIFEIVVPGYNAGSLGGGGRYDRLIEELSGVSVPAVGVAYGIDRMIEAAEEFKLFPAGDLGTKILVTVLDQPEKALSAARQLRAAGYSAEVYPDTAKLDKQLKYADKKGIPFAVIIGAAEASGGRAAVKNLRTGEQTLLAEADLVNFWKK